MGDLDLLSLVQVLHHLGLGCLLGLVLIHLLRFWWDFFQGVLNPMCFRPGLVIVLGSQLVISLIN